MPRLSNKEYGKLIARLLNIIDIMDDADYSINIKPEYLWIMYEGINYDEVLEAVEKWSTPCTMIGRDGNSISITIKRGEL